MPKILIALAALLAAAPSQGADWEFVTTTGTSNVYIDAAGIQSRGKARTAWFLFDHLDTRYDIDSARVFKSSTHQIDVDCTAQTLAWTRMEKFSGPLGTGNKVSARNIDTQTASFLETVPDDARAAMAASVCVE